MILDLLKIFGLKLAIFFIGFKNFLSIKKQKNPCEFRKIIYCKPQGSIFLETPLEVIEINTSKIMVMFPNTILEVGNEYKELYFYFRFISILFE